ncbi:hypothetical protein ACSFE6_07690 [Pseudomonas baetica]|uniref:hypothetical protein n=1 Tax=Pseudomonas baetica TaxID=674054 RepID=UPI003EEFA454
MSHAPDLPTQDGQQKAQNTGYKSDSNLVESLRMPQDNIDFNPERAIILSRPLPD